MTEDSKEKAQIQDSSGGSTALWVLAVFGGFLVSLLVLTALGPLTNG